MSETPFNERAEMIRWSRIRTQGIVICLIGAFVLLLVFGVSVMVQIRPNDVAAPYLLLYAGAIFFLGLLAMAVGAADVRQSNRALRDLQFLQGPIE